MAEIFHSADFFLAHIPDNRQSGLDIGCGSGLLALDLAPHFKQFVALDVSFSLLSIAQVKRARNNLIYCQMDASQLGFAPKFDYIVSRNVFHHLDNISGVLERLKKVLRPGGRLLLTDVISNRETPPTIVYVVGAIQEYLPNCVRLGWNKANRIFRFRVSGHWLSHLATDKYLSKEAFVQTYGQHLPNCVFPHPGCVIWDKPIE